MPSERVGDLKVEKLILSGEEYKPQDKSVPGIVFGGMFSSAKA